jgi:glycerophosphoryl diester phosphodiesterase
MLALVLFLAASEPAIIAHRGLFREAPENTLAAFGACLELRLGFELDIRRTKDGTLVCLHDETLDRTTNDKGPLVEHTLAEVRRLDAGAWFHGDFAGERVPTLEEVFALVQARKQPSTRVMLDLKIDDGRVEAEVVALAQKYKVSSCVVFIGTTIDRPAVRERILQADATAAVARLAQTRDNLPEVLADKAAHWAYLRFVPTAAEVKRLHAAGKKVFVVGTTVAGHEPKNWAAAKAAGVDAILTDFPLECRRTRP